MWSQKTSVTSVSTAEPELELWASLHHGTSFRNSVQQEIKIDDFQVNKHTFHDFSNYPYLCHEIPFKYFLASLWRLCKSFQNAIQCSINDSQHGWHLAVDKFDQVVERKRQWMDVSICESAESHCYHTVLLFE